jgi:hypothetical protein
VPARFAGMGCSFVLQWEFEDPDPLLRKQATTLFIQECNKRGIFAAGGMHMCWAHTEAELEELKPRWEEVLGVLRDAIRAGDIAGRLEAEVSKEAFRRLVR